MEIPLLHSDTIEAVQQRLDLVEIVGEKVVLRKRGKDYVGLCPFHTEKSPSFTVSSSKQLYHCFGCGAGGNGIKFLMELDKQSFGEVVLELARRYQVPIKTQTPQEHQELQRILSTREQLYEILAVAATFYQHALHQPQGEKALMYLLQKRQLSLEIISQFSLGYAPAGWETLYRYLVETKRYSVSLVEQAGLIRSRAPRNSPSTGGFSGGGGYYDYFRDRLIIPIRDSQGRVVAFGSRSLGSDEPKYLHSPETELFNKRKILFALDRAKSAISKQDKVIIVEGYFDAIALHSVGITYSVASLGTALSQDQIKSLLRYTESKQIFFNFDADQAGITATQRAIKEIETLVYTGQVQLKILTPSLGSPVDGEVGIKDVDEFLRSRPDAVELYQQQITDAPLWLDWQITQILAGKNLQDGESFRLVTRLMIGMLNQIEDRAQRDYYLQLCAEKLSQGDGRLTSRYSQTLLREIDRLRKKSDKNDLKIETLDTPEDSLLERAEFLLLLVFLHCPRYRELIIESLTDKDLVFSLSQHRFIWHKMLEINEDNQQSLLERLKDLSPQWPEEIQGKLMMLLDLNELRSEDIARVPLIVQASIAAIELSTLGKQRNFYLQKWHQLDPVNNWDKMQYYHQEMQDLSQQILNLDRLRQFSILESINF